ncbi:hypothetical protein [Microbacterium karelineae]|uniref:hypothetical protein n=1 Tax=Microbacterium karelineae TaxID=2654283 RepID=UPI0012E9FA01|nr:hypothetical protein [Microbacterium karelineae]
MIAVAATLIVTDALDTSAPGTDDDAIFAEFDELVVDDGGIVTADPELHAYDVVDHDGEIGFRGGDDWLPVTLDNAPARIDEWIDGTTFVVGDAEYTLAGIDVGACSDYARELMAGLTAGREVLLEPTQTEHDVLVWIVSRTPSGRIDSVQLTNAVAYYFGAGAADSAAAGDVMNRMGRTYTDAGVATSTTGAPALASALAEQYGCSE